VRQHGTRVITAHNEKDVCCSTAGNATGETPRARAGASRSRRLVVRVRVDYAWRALHSGIGGKA